MQTTEKLTTLREKLRDAGMGRLRCLAGTSGSEYVGSFFKTRAWLSGFTGSAGTLVVLPERAALWTDGRYFLQAGQQLAGSTIELMREGAAWRAVRRRFSRRAPAVRRRARL